MTETGNWAVDELLKAEEEANNIIKNAQSERFTPFSFIFLKFYIIFHDFFYLFLYFPLIFQTKQRQTLERGQNFSRTRD